MHEENRVLKNNAKILSEQLSEMGNENKILSEENKKVNKELTRLRQDLHEEVECHYKNIQMIGTLENTIKLLKQTLKAVL